MTKADIIALAERAEHRFLDHAETALNRWALSGGAEERNAAAEWAAILASLRALAETRG